MKKIRMKKLLLLFILCICYSSANAQLNSVKIGTNFFSSIGDAYIAISSTAPITQSFVIEIQSSYNGSTEARPITLEQIEGTSSINTITIRPALGASNLSIGDAINGSGIIMLDGADYVIIDGRPGGVGTSRQLTIRNSSTASAEGTSAVRFINDAEYNTILYCNLINMGTDVSNSLTAAVQFGYSNIKNGNSNNWITRNFFTDDASIPSVLPTACITSNGMKGSPKALNSNNRITNNDMQNFYARGIMLLGLNGNGWQIDSNNFNQNTSKTLSSQFCISIYSDVNLSIRNNNIGDPNELDSFYVPSSVSFTGILAADASSGTIANNNISFIRLSSISTSTMINIENSESFIIDNNSIFNIIQRGTGEMRGIFSNAPNAVITNNTIADMQSLPGSSANNNLKAIVHSQSGSKVTISGNYIEGLITSGSSTTFTNLNVNSLNAISVGDGDSAFINNNFIENIGLLNTGAVNNNAFGILCLNTRGCIVNNNRIQNVYNNSTGTASRTGGILFFNAPGRQLIYNNLISIGYDQTTGINNSQTIYGILYAGAGTQTGPLSIFYNSVYINGRVSSGTDSTFAFQRAGNVPSVVKNNIFANIRTGGTGSHYAVSVINSSSNWQSANINNNDLYTRNSATVGNWLTNTYNLSDWKTNSGADANSINLTPRFHSLTNFNLLPNSLCYGNAVPVSGITSDYHGITRSASTPTIGALELTSFVEPQFTGTYTSPPLNMWNMLTNTAVAGGTEFNASVITPSSGAEIRGQFFSGGRTGSYSGVVNASPYFWTISTDAAFVTCSVRFYFNNIPANGVNAPNTLRVMHRRGEDESWVLWDELATTRTATYIEISGVNGFSEFAFGGDIDNPLPVELASFTASVQERNVVLAWKTLSEINNSGFDLERKTIVTSQGTEEGTLQGILKRSMKGSNGELIKNDFNGQSTEGGFNVASTGGDFNGEETGAWTKIANISGNGNSQTENFYSYTDRNLNKGIYQYRLKQIDFNGNYTYINLNGDVNIGVPVKFELSQNYPNPFNPTTKINFSLPKDSKVSLKIFDITGREVARLLNNEFKQADYYTIDFNAFNLSSGVYFYKLQADNFIETKKMLLLK